MKTYIPRPDSIAEKAIAYLREHGRQPMAPLCDAIDADPRIFTACMATALRHGAVKREKWDGHNCWAIGDGAPPVEGEDPDEDAPKQTVVPAPPSAGVEIDAAHVFRIPLERTPAPEAPAASNHFRCGLWSDGQTTIEKGALRLTLSKDQTRQLAMLLGVPA